MKESIFNNWQQVREYGGPARRARPEWQRQAGPSGGTCGSVHTHRSGWIIEHCGHPTALWPYYITDPDGRPHIDPVTGRAFRNLASAKARLLDLVAGQQ